MKNKLIIGIVVMAAVVLISGASILAFASPGSQTDPFVTLSYLTDVFRPQVMTDVRNTEQEMTQKFNSRVSELESQMQANPGGSGTAESPAAYIPGNRIGGFVGHRCDAAAGYA